MLVVTEDVVGRPCVEIRQGGAAPADFREVRRRGCVRRVRGELSAPALQQRGGSRGLPSLRSGTPARGQFFRFPGPRWVASKACPPSSVILRSYNCLILIAYSQLEQCSARGLLERKRCFSENLVLLPIRESRC